MKSITMNHNLLTFTVGFLLILANSTVTITDTSNPAQTTCPQSANQDSAGQPDVTTTSIDFISASSFYDHTINNYNQVMVKDSEPDQPFKFLYFDENSIRQEVSCSGTTGFQFIRLINNVLFLRKTSPEEEFHACVFYPSPTLNSVDGFTTKTILLPTGLSSPITKIIPFSVRQTAEGSDWTIKIAFSDGTNAKIAQYAWSTIDSSATVQTSTITNTFTELDGVENVIYTNLDGFQIFNSGSFAANTELLPTPASQNIVKFYRTLTKTSLIGVYNSDYTSATFYKVQVDAQPQITEFDQITESSTAAFKDFLDDSSNIMIVSSTQVAWINVDNEGTLLKVVATTTEIPTENLGSVAFDGKTAVFTYSDRLVTYEITGNNTLSKSLTSCLVAGQSQTVSLSQICRIVTRFSCVSSTLDCLLIRKGTQNCAAPSSLSE